MKGSIEPLVDVVIAVFNGEAFLRDALDSVALQKEHVAKLIIINDGSTDNTARVIEDFSIAHPDIAVLTKHQENQGLAASLNRDQPW